MRTRERARDERTAEEGRCNKENGRTYLGRKLRHLKKKIENIGNDRENTKEAEMVGDELGI